MAFEDTLNSFYRKRKEVPYFSILPTATQYARNAIFSGLTPLDMEKKYPQWWRNDTEEGGKNLFEAEFLEAQLKRLGLELKWDYHKISSLKQGKHLSQNLGPRRTTTLRYSLQLCGYALAFKTEMDVVKELAANDKAYRSPNTELV